MDIEQGTPIKTIRISEVDGWEVPMPFTAGHVLKANEAEQLNQVLHENLRNNFAPTVKKAREEQGDDFDQSTLQGELNEYILEYDFGVRRGGMFRPKDPVEAASLDIARELVRAALKREGVKLKDVTAATITQEALKAIEKYPQIREQAEKVVEAQKSATAGISLEVDASEAESAA